MFIMVCTKRAKWEYEKKGVVRFAEPKWEDDEVSHILGGTEKGST